ncbi:MAG: acylneuraminate cytidylyltransferase family protein [Gammaproteobacteria bacterium]|nr:acylneuraminate cytidylyltransferase family protein [Gammaproteobacteria bacterium]
MITHAFIFARGGSKGVPGKNIKLLGGKPMLAYSVEIAQRMSEVERIFISTDDEKIAEVARTLGVEVISRPAELADDHSPEWLAWQHSVEYVEKKYGKFDVFVSIPVTAPLRSIEDMEMCLAALTDDTDIVVTVSEAHNNPYFNMVRIDDTGRARLFCAEKEHYIRRQDVPSAYNMTTVAYVARKNFILQATGIFDGVVKAVVIPQERSLDIDTLVDFSIAQCLIDDAV